MGNSESSAAAAGSDIIQAAIKKEKKRAKRWCCFGFWCNFGALILMVIGIAMLVLFAVSLGDNYPADKTPAQGTAK